MKRLIALVLLLTLLCGCGATNSLGFHGVVAFEDMEYRRPDMDELQALLDACTDLAAKGTDIDALVDAIWDFYDGYDAFNTNYDLAYIHYNADLTDYYWQTEHNWCAERSPEADAMLEELFYALAASPLRDTLEGEDYYGAGYFDYYDGESLYDEDFVALLEREQTLISEYYDLNGEAMAGEYYTDAWFDQWTVPMTEILVELVKVRQEMAAYAGYDSYAEFAYDFYYYRDYTWQEAEGYCAAIREGLVDIYRHVNGLDVWDSPTYCSGKETLSYVADAAKAMGGTVDEAFRLLEEGGLYDISVGANKSGSSFALYLETYYEPYVFVSAAGDDWDKLTFSHEFGHFVNDYASAGGYAGTDVEEFFSQGMEYLSLCYSDDAALERLKMADCLCTYVEQAAYAEFEHRMYGLSGEELTAENLLALYEQVCLSYGFDSFAWDSRDLFTVPHYYEQPLYIISYVFSNDAALQLYQLERSKPGAGLARFEDNLTSEEYYFLTFVEDAGLESPLKAGRIDAVLKTMEEIFPR